MPILNNEHFKINKNNICEVFGAIDESNTRLHEYSYVDLKNHDTAWYAYSLDEPETSIFLTFDADINKKLPFYFADYLIKLKSKTYHDFLLLCTLYMRNIKLNKKKHQSYFDSINSKKIKDILKPTYGALVFTYQLEEIYSIVSGCSIDEAVLFRKNWNKKRKDIAKQILDMNIQKDMSLLDLIINTTTNTDCFVFSPNYQGASIINNIYG